MITVFTPAYNRANLLDRLYASLVNQQCKDFEWLIVDDGSSDNTKDVVNSFIQDNKIDIRYIYQDNKGKHVAFNTGVKNANGNLFFCVDSDDFLSDNCISDIVECSECVSNDNIAGIIAKKTDTTPLTELTPATAGDLDSGLIPGSGRSPGEGNGSSLQYSCLENPKDRGAWRATVHGVIKSWTQLSD